MSGIPRALSAVLSPLVDQVIASSNASVRIFWSPSSRPSSTVLKRQDRRVDVGFRSSNTSLRLLRLYKDLADQRESEDRSEDVTECSGDGFGLIRE